MLSVGRILEGAFGLVRERYVAVAAWAGIYLAANIALAVAVRPLLGQSMSPAMTPNPTDMFVASGPVFLIALFFAAFGFVIYAAAMRAILRPEAGGIAYLRLGMDELRLFGVAILFSVGGTILFLIVTFAFGLVGVGIAASGDPGIGSALLGLLFILALLAVVVFFIVRFSLAFPLTLYRQQIVIGEAWTLSRGHFWSLFGAALVITLILMVLNIAVSAFTMGSYMSDLMSAAGNPEALARAAEAQQESYSQLGPAMILASLGGAVAAALGAALTGGSVATAAKLLLHDEMDDAEDVFG